jgi:hypothetical protein
VLRSGQPAAQQIAVDDGGPPAVMPDLDVLGMDLEVDGGGLAVDGADVEDQVLVDGITGAVGRVIVGG